MEIMSKPLRNPRTWRKAILSYYIWFGLLGKPLLQCSFSTDAQESSVAPCHTISEREEIEMSIYTHADKNITVNLS